MRFYNFYYHYDCSTFYFSRYSKAKYSIFIISGFTSSRSHNIYIDRWIFLFTVIVFIWRTPAPPLPEITYGEFPFRLEYELNEELHVIEDTLIVEFDGFGMNEGIGRYRRWTSRLASGEDLVLLLEVSDNKQIFYFPGPANYYMGDRLNGYNHTFPSASFIERERGITRRDILHDKELLEQFGPLDQNTINEEELLNQYNIRLVNWEISEPIVNNFGD